MLLTEMSVYLLTLKPDSYTRESPQIQWFWNIVQTLSQEDLARLLQFGTGTSQV